MLEVVMAELPRSDALLMAAAVADFRPARPAEQKIKKDSGRLVIELEVNPDILGAVAGVRAKNPYPEVVVGFAAESQELIHYAQAKLAAKKLDLIAANDISAPDAGFGADTNRVTLLDPAGNAEALPLLTKMEVAERVLERVAALLQTRLVVHICSRLAWEQAQADGVYRPPSLEQEGFIHFSRPRQAVGVANRYFHGQPDLVVLWTDPQRLEAELRWEVVEQERYPHLYGSLNASAVFAAIPFEPEADGTFRTLPVASH
jgi:uncharacterized protein (DUF952 family)